uniref:hypothetical protein n=1 Tax=Acinetobacter baumannii TaxID=470 RepID=UPI001C069060
DCNETTAKHKRSQSVELLLQNHRQKTGKQPISGIVATKPSTIRNVATISGNIATKQAGSINKKIYTSTDP